MSRLGDSQDRLQCSIESARARNSSALSPKRCRACDGKQLWTANPEANTLSVIDMEQKKVIATLPVGKRPRHLVIGP